MSAQGQSPEESEEQQVYRQYRFSLPPGATDLLLVRHGESAPARMDVPAPKADGHSDPELAPEGREQAERLGERLAHEKIDAIFVTTLRRTAETAAPLAKRLGLEPIVEPDLREIFLGEWEGVAFRKYVAEQHPTAVRMMTEQRWDAIPGAESNDEFAARVARGLDRIIAAHPGQRVVVVVHGGVIGQALALATGTSAFTFLGADNASITQIVALPAGSPVRAASGRSGWIVRRFNDTAHLDPVLSIAPEPLT